MSWPVRALNSACSVAARAMRHASFSPSPTVIHMWPLAGNFRTAIVLPAAARLACMQKQQPPRSGGSGTDLLLHTKSLVSANVDLRTISLNLILSGGVLYMDLQGHAWLPMEMHATEWLVQNDRAYAQGQLSYLLRCWIFLWYASFTVAPTLLPSPAAKEGC